MTLYNDNERKPATSYIIKKSNPIPIRNLRDEGSVGEGELDTLSLPRYAESRDPVGPDAPNPPMIWTKSLFRQYNEYNINVPLGVSC